MHHPLTNRHVMGLTAANVSQAKVRSTTHLRGKTTKLSAPLERLMISTVNRSVADLT